MKLSIPGFSRYYLETDDNCVYNNRDHRMSSSIIGDDFKDRRIEILRLVNDNGVSKNIRKHRLVYMAYHPEEDISELQINHLDEDPLNNSINNLRACTASENVNYGTGNLRRSLKKKGIPNTSVSVEVEAYVIETGKTEYYMSVAQAARTVGVTVNSIWSALDIPGRTSSGRVWTRHHGG